jgi:N-methylhydantoinase A
LMARRGVDPRDFALFAYGGAGPTHACLLAEETGLRRVLVPPAPGTLCARGALATDVKSDYIRVLRRGLDELAPAELEAAYADLERRASAWLVAEHIPVERVRLERSADMRYVGQGFSINVAADRPPGGGLGWLVDRFHERHQALFRHSDPAAPVELTTLRLAIVGETPKPRSARLPTATTPARPFETRAVYDGGRFVDCAVYRRSDLRSGDRLSGPCIVEQYDTTTFVSARFGARCDDSGNLVLEATA